MRRLLLAGSLLALLPVIPAQAADYRVNVCRHADGTPAPTDGWAFTIKDDVQPHTATDTCSQSGGSVYASLPAGVAHRYAAGGEGGTIQWKSPPPPAGTEWRQIAINRGGRVRTSQSLNLRIVSFLVGLDASGDERFYDGCSAYESPGQPMVFSPPSCGGHVGNVDAAPLDAANNSVRAVLNTGAPSAPNARNPAREPLLGLNVGCVGSATAAPPDSTCQPTMGSPYAGARVWRMALTLTDTAAPTLDALPEIPAGAQTAVLSASDVGGGVRTAQFVSNGKPVGQPRTLDTAGGRCVAQPDGSFDYLTPCKTKLVRATTAMDTTGLPLGPASLVLRVADVAGNTVDSAPQAVTIARPSPTPPGTVVGPDGNPVPATNLLAGQGHIHNGSGAADVGKLTAGFRNKHGLKRTGRIAAGRTIKLRGRLREASGTPIRGATLQILDGSTLFVVHTRKDGRYSKTLKWGPSRQVTVQWWPWGDSPEPLAVRVRLLGAANIRFSVCWAGENKRCPAFKEGKGFRFRGFVYGAPKGARVTVQALQAGRWVLVSNPAIDGSARFHAARKVTVAGQRLCFRSRWLAQAGSPYSAGFSRKVCSRAR